MWIRAMDNTTQRLINVANADMLFVEQENSYGPWCLVAVFPAIPGNTPHNLTHVIIFRSSGTDSQSYQDMTEKLCKIEEQLAVRGEVLAT